MQLLNRWSNVVRVTGQQIAEDANFLQFAVISLQQHLREARYLRRL